MPHRTGEHGIHDSTGNPTNPRQRQGQARAFLDHEIAPGRSSHARIGDRASSLHHENAASRVRVHHTVKLPESSLGWKRGREGYL